MSELARQYNLIGETLRRGVGDLLEGQMQSDALDLTAAKMGLEEARSERNYSMELKKFRANQKERDDNAKRWERANALKLTQDEYRLNTMNEQATRHTMGANTPWMEEHIAEKIEPELTKLGITYQVGPNGKGGYYQNGQPMTQAQLWSNGDVVALFKAYTELDDVLVPQIKFETQELKNLMSKTPEQLGVDPQTYKTMVEAQQQTVKLHQDQLAHKEKYPVKYLNQRINGIFRIMQSSPNQAVLNKELELLLAERNKLLDQQIAKGAMKSTDYEIITYYGPDGTKVNHRVPWNAPNVKAQVTQVMKNEGLTTNPDIGKQFLGAEDKTELADTLTGLYKALEQIKTNKSLSPTALALLPQDKINAIKSNPEAAVNFIEDQIMFYKGVQGLDSNKYNSREILALSNQTGIPVEELYRRAIIAESAMANTP